MKKIIFIAALLGLLFYVFNILNSTGFFRTVENKFSGQLVRSVPIAGVEDLTVDGDDKFAIFISYDRAAERDGKDFETGVYFMDLSNNTFEPRLISQDFDKPFLPHGISLLQIDSSHHKLFVVNHGGGESIEIFDLYKRDSLVHFRTIKNDLIYSPNDVVAVAEDEFYVTNDTYFTSTFGKTIENYLGLARCETIHAKGNKFKVVNDNLAYANGINYDKDRELIYIAAVRSFSVNVFKRKSHGDLRFIETIDCGTGVDNIEIGPEGALWIGCHPNLLAFKSYQKGRSEIAPSELIKIKYYGEGDYDLESFYVNDGSQMSGATIAAPYKDLILTGNVMDERFIVLRNKN